MVPSSPLSTRRLASAYPESKRLWKPIWSMAPEDSTASTTPTVSSWPSAIGFSQNAGMPASTEASIRGACAGVEVAMTTASGPDRRMSSMVPDLPPTSAATPSARRESASPTRISSTLGSPASRPACNAPMRPAPNSPTFIWAPRRRACESPGANCAASTVDGSGLPSPPYINPPTTMLLEYPFRVNGPLAGNTLAEIRGCILVEEQGGVRVVPQHRGRHTLRDFSLECRGDGLRLVGTRGEEQNLPGFGDGRHADRDGPLGRAVGLEVGGVDEARALGERHDARARIERRTWLVKPDVTVASDPEHAHVHTAELLYGRLVALTFGLGIGGGAVGNEDAGGVGVYEGVEMFLHVGVVTRRMVGYQPEIFVEVEEGGLRESDLTQTVQVNEAAVHTERCRPRRQQEDGGRVFLDPARYGVGRGRAHGLVVGEDAGPHRVASLQGVRCRGRVSNAPVLGGRESGVGFWLQGTWLWNFGVIVPRSPFWLLVWRVRSCLAPLRRGL